MLPNDPIASPDGSAVAFARHGSSLWGRPALGPALGRMIRSPTVLLLTCSVALFGVSRLFEDAWLRLVLDLTAELLLALLILRQGWLLLHRHRRRVA